MYNIEDPDEETRAWYEGAHLGSQLVCAAMGIYAEARQRHQHRGFAPLHCDDHGAHVTSWSGGRDE
jgi:hypothetical protein